MILQDKINFIIDSYESLNSDSGILILSNYKFEVYRSKLNISGLTKPFYLSMIYLYKLIDNKYEFYGNINEIFATDIVDDLTKVVDSKIRKIKIDKILNY